MDVWWPRLQDVDVPVPATDKLDLDDVFQGFQGDGMDIDSDPVHDAVNAVGGYPAFIRTDATSHKHDMADASHLPDRASIPHHIATLLEHNLMVNVPFHTLYVREWLELDEYFTAFNGLAIAPELRFLVKDGTVRCHHFYWPKDSIKFRVGTEQPADWHRAYKACKDTALEEAEEVELLVEQVAQEFDGFWSVDFAKAADGTWYLIDMARGEVSQHPHDRCDVLPDDLFLNKR